MSNTLRVEQEVYVKPMGNEARRNSEIRVAKVTKVVRKYFELRGQNGQVFRNRFNLDTLLEDTEYTVNFRVYLSFDELNLEEEDRMLRKVLCSLNFNDQKITIEQLRAIVKILDPMEN